MSRHEQYYQQKRIPCECGSHDAYWHGDTQRVYVCPRCWLASLSEDDPRREEAEEQVRGLYGDGGGT